MERIKYLYSVIGNREQYIGEKITIIQHSLQVANEAKKAGETEEVQIACFLHDIGHLLGLETSNELDMEGCGINNHESLGALFLSILGFTENIINLVSNHVNAKRYLCGKNSDYYNKLTDASKITLKYQGGPMNQEQLISFENNPLFETIIRCRKYDELGKDTENLLDINDETIYKLCYKYMISYNSLNKYILSTIQQNFYKKHGYIIIKNPLSFIDINSDELFKITETVENLPNDKNFPWLKYYEEVNNISQICRIENFSKYHNTWNKIVTYICQIVSQLYGENATLLKDKINLKYPGGEGFLQHQDITAYAPEEFSNHYISAMLAIDNCQCKEKGPLEIANGRHKEGIFENNHGVINKNIKFDFNPVYVETGDLILFCSYLPHKAEKNTSLEKRRSAFFTYNKLSDGDFNQEYYHKKFQFGNYISINKDFAGKIVEN